MHHHLLSGLPLATLHLRRPPPGAQRSFKMQIRSYKPSRNFPLYFEYIQRLFLLAGSPHWLPPPLPHTPHICPCLKACALPSALNTLLTFSHTLPHNTQPQDQSSPLQGNGFWHNWQLSPLPPQTHHCLPLLCSIFLLFPDILLSWKSEFLHPRQCSKCFSDINSLNFLIPYRITIFSFINWGNENIVIL